MTAWPAADDLAGLGHGGRDHAVGVRDERRIGERVLLQGDGALGLDEGADRLIGRRPRLVEIGSRRPAFAAQLGDALALGDRLVARGARRRKRGLGLLQLQLPIGLIEDRERIAGLHTRAAIDEPFRDLAGDAKAEIALDARLDHADQSARREGRREMRGDDEDRALGSGSWPRRPACCKPRAREPGARSRWPRRGSDDALAWVGAGCGHDGLPHDGSAHDGSPGG